MASGTRTAVRAAWPKNPVGGEPDKDLVWAFGDVLYAELTALQLAQVGLSLAYATRDDLYTNETAAAGVGAGVWADPTPARNGVYTSDGSGTGSGRWTKIADLGVETVAADLLALTGDVDDLAADVAAVETDVATVESDITAVQTRATDLERRATYVATSITGTVNALIITTGKSLSALVAGMRISFRATPGANTGPATATVDSTGEQPVKRGNGSDLRPNDLLGKQWQQTFEWTGNVWRLIGSSQLVEVAEQFGTRDDDGAAFTDANDIIAGELEPSGRLAMPAVWTESVAGVPAGWLRREHLSTVSHLPLVVGNFVYGQSNALANKAVQPLSTLRSGRNMKMFIAGVRAFAGGGTPSENRDSLVPHVEAYSAAEGDAPERGETSCFGAAETFCDLVETEQGWPDYASTVMVISAASGEGSSTIAQLMASEPFDRFMLDVSAASTLAKAEFGSDVVLTVPPVFFNQIEANVEAETDPEEWIDEMIAAQVQIEAGINTARGVATSEDTRVPLIIPQAATWNHYGKTPALALAAVTLAQMSDKFILLPSYMLEFSDGVHYTAESQHSIVGPRNGYIQKRIVINGQARSTFAPSVPIDNNREGKFAQFTFHTWAGDDLTVDTKLVRKVLNFGLEAFEDDDETPATISRVWVHPRELIVKFASNPTAGMHLKNGLAGTGNGWNEGPRSNLRTKHGDHVTARTMQGVVPVHEWVPAFNYQLS